MPSKNREALLGSIAGTIADYRRGELPTPTAAHVDRWVSQFPRDVQEPMLSEFETVLQRTYITQEALRLFLRDTLFDRTLVGQDAAGFWSAASVLQIQLGGRSQSDLLALLDGELADAFGFGLHGCSGSGDTYIYVDDVLFTGRRIGNDLTLWIAKDAPGKGSVHIVVNTAHTSGIYWLLQRLRSSAIEAGKRLSFRLWPKQTVENRLAYRDTSPLLWPSVLPDVPAVHRYMAVPQQYPFEPRTAGSRIGPYSSEAGRALMERELLLAGVSIRERHANPSDVMRPLGFSAFGLGFGSLSITYRNCPNNAPLALWWGLGGWYPLFRRKTYEAADDYSS
jgi:hypothetical protein